MPDCYAVLIVSLDSSAVSILLWMKLDNSSLNSWLSMLLFTIANNYELLIKSTILASSNSFVQFFAYDSILRSFMPDNTASLSLFLSSDFTNDVRPFLQIASLFWELRHRIDIISKANLILSGVSVGRESMIRVWIPWAVKWLRKAVFLVVP